MIKIYTLDVSSLTDKEEYRRLYENLPSFRKEKVEHLHFYSDRLLSVGAGTLLCDALSDFGICDTNLVSVENEHGKPFFPSLNGRFEYSLSHSGFMAMCAVSYAECGNAPMIGCDVEKISERCNLKIAKRYFTEGENKLIASLTDEEEKRNMFCRLWTLKESYIKCTGLGFSCPLNSFSIDLTHDDNITIFPKELNEKFSFGEFEKESKDGYRYAWCVEK